MVTVCYFDLWFYCQRSHISVVILITSNFSRWYFQEDQNFEFERCCSECPSDHFTLHFHDCKCSTRWNNNNPDARTNRWR
jgi:hypothetical protein